MREGCGRLVRLSGDSRNRLDAQAIIRMFDVVWRERVRSGMRAWVIRGFPAAANSQPYVQTVASSRGKRHASAASAHRALAREEQRMDLRNARLHRSVCGIDHHALARPRLVVAGEHLAPCGKLQSGDVGDARLDAPAMLACIGADQLDLDDRHACTVSNLAPGGTRAR